MSSRKQTFCVYIVAILICCLPFLRYYDVIFTSINLGSVLSLLLVFFLFLLPAFRNGSKSLTFLILFSLYALFVTLLRMTANDLKTESINAIIYMVLSVLVISLLMTKKIDKNVLCKVYSFFVWVCIFIFLMQYSLSFFAIKVDFRLPFHSFSDSWSKLANHTFGMDGEVPTSIFAERAHFCQYIVPYLALCLFKKREARRADLFKAMLVSVVMVLTISGNGIVLTAIAWALFFLFSERTFAKKMGYIIGGAVLIVAAYFVLDAIPSTHHLFDTLFVNRTGSSSWTKADYRVYRGLDFFGNMPFLDKFFGIGYRTIQSYSNVFGIYSIYDSDSLYSYLSAVSQLLIYFGIIGTALFSLHLFCLQKGQNKITKSTIILFVALAFSTETLFEEYHVLFMALACCHLMPKKLFRCMESTNEKETVYSYPLLQR